MAPNDPLQLYKQGYAEVRAARSAAELQHEAEGRRMQQAQARLADQRHAALIRTSNADLEAELAQLDAEIDVDRTAIAVKEQRRNEIAQAMTRRGLSVDL